MPLEIQSLVLALVVVLLITLMAFMKWKSTEARKDEIRKLLLVAAEEARRVEAEHRDYGVAVDRLSLNQCAVCFSTTTSRCSRCKTVKYWLAIFFLELLQPFFIIAYSVYVTSSWVSIQNVRVRY